MGYYEISFFLPNIVWNDMEDKRVILAEIGSSITYIAESLVGGKWVCVGKSTSFERARLLCLPKKDFKKRVEKPKDVEVKVVVNPWIIKN